MYLGSWIVDIKLNGGVNSLIYDTNSSNLFSESVHMKNNVKSEI